LSFGLGAGDQVMNFPCQSSGMALAALPSQVSMADVSACVFGATGCREKAVPVTEISH